MTQWFTNIAQLSSAPYMVVPFRNNVGNVSVTRNLEEDNICVDMLVIKRNRKHVSLGGSVTIQVWEYEDNEFWSKDRALLRLLNHTISSFVKDLKLLTDTKYLPNKM